jgi:hypothetical protein
VDDLGRHSHFGGIGRDADSEVGGTLERISLSVSSIFRSVALIPASAA